MRKLTKILTMVFLSVVLVTPIYANINLQLTQVTAINLLKASKSRADSNSINWIDLRQNIEDLLANQSANLDVSDVTKLNVLIVKIQEIIDKNNALSTAITNNYPEVN